MFKHLYARGLNWIEIQSVFPFLETLKGSAQSPIYHVEGDVYIHTCMVVEALVNHIDFKKLNDDEQEIAFLTALFHDIAKPITQKIEDDGRITNKHHSRIGSYMTREILYDMGYDYRKREIICNLITVHQEPFWIINHEDTLDYQTILMSLTTNSLKLLALQAKADIIGRVCPDQEGILLNIDLFEDHAKTLHCWDQPFLFANEHTKRQYLIDYHNKSPFIELYDPLDDGFVVSILSGLPGSGKSTIASSLNQPIVSMDIIRKENKIDPTDNQGLVKQLFLNQVKVLLAQKKPFIIDNVNLDRTRRTQLIDLCCSYKAKTKLIYKELDKKLTWQRNISRQESVPLKAWNKLIKKMEPPTSDEAHFLEYI